MMRDPPSVAAPLRSRGRPKARESSGLVGRCKSAPIPTCRPPDMSSKMELDEIETAEQKEAKWAPTTTLFSTMGSRTGSRTLGQGTIDQYFTVKIKDERVEMAQLLCSASTTSNVSQRSTCPRPSTSTFRIRPDPPSSTTVSSTCRRIDIEPNVAEERDDTQNDSRSKEVVHTISTCRSSPSSQDSSGGTVPTSSTVQGEPGDDKRKICECTITNNNSTSADGTETVRLLKKGKYSTRLSLESKHVRERRSKSSIHVPPQRMPYSPRTVLIPPGRVGAVLQTSPLGPAIKRIKESSPIFDQVAVGDVVVEVDGIDTTSARAKEVTMMLINGAERERQIVVLSQETFDQEFSRDDESIIEENSPVDRYLGFYDDDDDDDDDDRGDDDEAILSASIASGATTVAAGNTQAHKHKRAKCRENLTKKLSTTVKIRVDTIKGAHSVCEGSAEEPIIWEAPERSMDAKTLPNMLVGLESRRSTVIGGDGFHPAPPSELTANRSSLTPKAVQKFDSDYDDDKEPFLLSPAISTTGSEISSLPGSLECSQFGDNYEIGSIVHDERKKVPLSPIGEESKCMSHHDQICQDTHDQEVLLVIGEHESNAIAGERTEPGFDLILPRIGEETSTAVSTLTPSLTDCGGDEQTEICIDKLGEPLILDEPEKWPGIVSQPPGQESVVADITVLVASTILSSGGTKQTAKRAAGAVLSLCESPTCIDFQSIASEVSLEILEAGGPQSCASCVVGAILAYQKETASRFNESKKDGMAIDQRENLSPPLLLEIISAKLLAKQNTEHQQFFQGTEAVVSLLSASRDQIVQDALQFSSLLKQSTENLTTSFGANVLAPTSTGTTCTRSTAKETAVKSSLPEQNEQQTFNPNLGSSQGGVERSFSTYQICCRTLIAAEGDTEVELFFPVNEFEQLDLDRRHVTVHVGQQDAPAEVSNDDLNVKPARSGPTKLFSTTPINKGVSTCRSRSRYFKSASRSTCGAFEDAETVPRSLLERWRSARRRQKAKRGRQR